MARRCPVCKEVLLTLRVGDLERCDSCEHYVDPDGAIVDAREGRILSALAEAGDEPRTVAELRDLLSRHSAAADDELRELCERHRQQVRARIDAMPWPNGVRFEKSEPQPGAYREAGRGAMSHVVLEDPVIRGSQKIRHTARAIAVLAISAAFGSLCLSQMLPPIEAPLLTAFLGLLVLSVVAMFFVSMPDRPVRRLSLEVGRDALEVQLLGRSGDRMVELPIQGTRLDRKFNSGDNSGTEIYLRGPKLEVLLLTVWGKPSEGRAATIRLEDALRLSGPAPAKEKR